MEVVIQPVPHGCHEMLKTDAISCTYNMNGFTPMNSTLVQHGLDREHFRRCSHLHKGDKFRVISHGYEKPFVITTTKTERWDSEPDAAQQIIQTADIERCKSLRMTHFAFIPGKFPEDAFAQCMRQVRQARYHTKLQRIVVEVDANYAVKARTVDHRVKTELEAVGSA